MTSIEHKWGIEDGAADMRGLQAPATVPGRVAQIDADFIAYQAGYCGAETYEEQQDACLMIIKKLKIMSGAESTHLHLTPQASNKGGRYESALFHPYQDTRGADKPEFLEELRAWMGHRTNASLYLECEADDGMCIAQTAAIRAGNKELSVICSKDKDLRMVEGWHLDWDTGELHDTDKFGAISLDRSKSTPKILGFGTSFFWAQMLMGDTADTIKGLPFVPSIVRDHVKPTGPATKSLLVIADRTSTPAKIATAKAYLAARKPLSCGAVTAFEIASKFKDDKQAYSVVAALYKMYNEEFKPVNYRNDKPITWREHLFSEAQSLWMRRELNALDFLNFIQNHGE